jgi:uncharacterized protein
MSIASQLFDLQTVDLELDGLKARLVAIQAALGDSAAVLAGRVATAEAGKKLATARGTQIDAELALRQNEEHLATVQGKLYGGTVRNPKDLVNLQQDAESLARQKDRLESDALELMEAADVAEAAARAARDELARAEAESAAGQAQLRAEAATITERVAVVTGQRDTMAAQLSRQTLAMYDGLRSQKGGHAVARLERASCMGCGVTMSSGEAQHARSAAAYGLAYCANCGRILFTNR